MSTATMTDIERATIARRLNDGAAIQPTDLVAVRADDGTAAQQGIACGFCRNLIVVVFPDGRQAAFFPNELVRIAPIFVH